MKIKVRKRILAFFRTNQAKTKQKEASLGSNNRTMPLLVQVQYSDKQKESTRSDTFQRCTLAQDSGTKSEKGSTIRDKKRC